MNFQTFYQRMNCSSKEDMEKKLKSTSITDVNEIILSKEFNDFFKSKETFTDKEINVLTAFFMIFKKELSYDAIVVLKNLTKKTRNYSDTLYQNTMYEYYIRSTALKPNLSLVVIDKEKDELMIKECIHYKKFAQLIGYSKVPSKQMLRYFENNFLEIGLSKYPIIDFDKSIYNELSEFSNYKTAAEVGYKERYYSIESCINLLNSHIVNQESDPFGRKYNTLKELDFLTCVEASYLFDFRDGHYFVRGVNRKYKFNKGYHRAGVDNPTVAQEDIYQPQYLYFANVTNDPSYKVKPTIIMEKVYAEKYYALIHGSKTVTPDLKTRFEEKLSIFRSRKLAKTV